MKNGAGLIPNQRTHNPWNRWDWIFLFITALLTVWAIYEASAERFAAAHNEHSFLHYSPLMGILGCLAWLFPLPLGFVMLLIKRPPISRWLAYSVIAVMPLVMGAGAFWFSNGQEGQFESGLQQWMAKVDPQPIQSWLRSQKSAAGAVMLPETDWPPEIKGLHPERVDFWHDRGVVLTWGRVGHDGDRRQLFIGRAADTAPPTEVLWLDDHWSNAWTEIADGWPAEWKKEKQGVWWCRLGGGA